MPSYVPVDADPFAAAPQGADGQNTRYTYAGTGQPLPNAQASVYDELGAAGGLDPHAAPGSPRLPRAQMSAADAPAAGEYYVPVGGGGVKQAPPTLTPVDHDPFAGAPRISQKLGFLDEMNNIAKHYAQVLPSQEDMLESTMGVRTDTSGRDEARQALDQWIAGQKAAGVVPGQWGAAAGDLIGTAPLSFAGGPITQGMLGGLATTREHTPLGVAKDAATGGILSYVGGKVIGGLLGHAISPRISPDAQQLVNEGVRLTPGQVMGGVPKTIEDTLTSVPVLKDSINSARLRGMQDFNRAAWNRALNPIGETLPADVNVGRDAAGHVQARLGQAYDQIAPQLKADFDPEFMQGVGSVRSSIAPRALDNLPTFDHILQSEVLARGAQSGSLDGQAAKDAQTAIGQHINKYQSSADPKTQALVEGLKGLNQHIAESIERNSPEGASQRLADINNGYANFTRTQTAAASLGAKGGLFTPAQLSNAVRTGDKTVRKGAFARGDALLQDLSSAGENVLPSSVPDSGTALRYLTSEIPMLLGFGAESQNFFPHLAGAVGALGTAGLPYTPMGGQVVLKALTKRPWTTDEARPVIGAIRGLLSAGARVAPPVAAGLLAPPQP